MLLYPKPALRLTEDSLATLADVPSPSSSPPPPKGSKTNAFFSVSSLHAPAVSRPAKPRLDASIPIPTPTSPVVPSPSSPGSRTPEYSPKSSLKDPWWAKLRRKREDTLPPSPIFTSSPLADSINAPFPSPTRSVGETHTSSNPPASPPSQTPRQGHVIPSSILKLTPGEILSSSDAELTLVKPLGEGAFSKVWLAQDTSTIPLTVSARKRTRELRKRNSSLWGSTTSPEHTNTNSDQLLSPEAQEVDLMRRNSQRKRTDSLTLGLGKVKVEGIRPSRSVHGGDASLSRSASIFLDGYSMDSVSRTSSASSSYSQKPKERFVAAKLVERSALESSPGSTIVTAEERDTDRARVSFIREVEVLKHISHPNIAPLLAHLTTPFYHVLVLPHMPGGDLFALIKRDNAWTKLRETVVQRIFIDLVNAVGWMHSVGLVHRDIKLENILLTSTAFNDIGPDTPPPSLDSIFQSGHPRDHSRAASCSSTNSHCGNSAPLIKLTDFGLSRFISPSSPLLYTRCGSEAYAAPELVMSGQNGYDARETDSWACGVCLYELSTGTLPFGSDEESSMNRRKWLFRIAIGQYHWPDAPPAIEGEERIGASLSTSPDIRRVVSKLLVRDPKARTLAADLWEDPWMVPEGEASEGSSDIATMNSDHLEQEMARITVSPAEASAIEESYFVDDSWILSPPEEWLVDVPEKDSIARQELV